MGFIGANKAGHELFAQCGRLGKTSSFNGNGKNYLVIMSDADLEQCSQWIIRAAFGMTGQRCLGVDNVVVVGDAYNEVRERLVALAKGMEARLRPGRIHHHGPLHHRGRPRQGGGLGGPGPGRGRLHGPRRPRRHGPGLSQGIFHGPPPSSKTSMSTWSRPGKRLSAPVASLIRGESLEQAIEWINTKTNLGHSACIMTASGKNARKFTHEVNVGNVGVNVGVAQPYAFFPLGSRRESFVGTAKSRMASMRMFMDEKTVTARWV